MAPHPPSVWPPSRWWLVLPAAGFPSFVAIHTGLNIYLGNSLALSGGIEGLLGLVVLAVILWGVLFAALRWGGVTGKSSGPCRCLCRLFPDLRTGVSFPAGAAGGRDELLSSGLASLPGRGDHHPGSGAGVAPGSAAPPDGSRGGDHGCCFCRLHPDRHRNSGVQPRRTGLSDPRRRANTATVSAADKPDVYQILFDTYQTVEYQYARKLKGMAPFDDFIHFNNNVSQYNWTCYSIPSTWTST